MSPWNIDAGDIRDDASFDSDLLYRTNQIEDFLEAQSDSVFFVTATKGLGKTFVLKAKSIKYIRDGIPLIHANILVDKPGIGSVVFDKEKLNLFSSIQNWSNLWTLAISLSTLKRLNLHDTISNFSPLIDKLCNLPARNITSYFKILLNLSINDYFNVVSELNNIVSPATEAIKTPIAAFIDNVDEYFEIHIDKNKFSSKSAEGQTSKDIWYLSQIGLIESIYQITSKNPHIKIFASIRKEVFLKLSDYDSKSLQYKGRSVELSYSKEELREIFYLNIKKESQSRLVDSNLQYDNPLYAFCGTNKVSHSYVEGESENIFDYIYRHTLQRPRDFMTIGRAISHIKRNNRTIESLQTVINDSSTEIADSYLQEVSPHLGDINFNDIFKLLYSNILTTSLLKNSCSKFNAIECDEIDCSSCSGTHIFCSMYSIGLLGYGKEDQVKRDILQEFLPPGMKSFDIPGKLPKSDYYLIHPCLYGLILKENPSFRPDKTNIVAPGQSLKPFLSWVKPKIKQSSRNRRLLSLPEKLDHCHIHFGGGRIGFGLVVPLFNNNSRLVVIQRPSDPWKKIKGTEKIELKINGKYLTHFDVIHDLSKKKGMKHILEKWGSNDNLLVCSSNTDLLKIFIENADSMSTSLGSGLNYIIELISNSILKKKINLYPFENDNNAVTALSNNLRSLTDKIIVVPVIADKICSKRTINSGLINIQAESYAAVTVQGKNKQVHKIFNAINNVTITRNVREQNHLYNKKLYIVNGIHMISAIYGYSYLFEKQIPFSDWKNYHLNILMDNSDFKNIIKLFIAMQSLRLLIETDKETLFNLYNSHNMQEIYNGFLSYGHKCLDRFESSVDLIVRILNLENIIQLEGKYKARIEKLIKFIDKKIDKIATLDLKNKPDKETLYHGILDLQSNTSNLFLQIIKDYPHLMSTSKTKKRTKKTK